MQKWCEREREREREGILRWNGTPYNIFKDDRILKMITTTVFKISKSLTFAPKMHL